MSEQKRGDLSESAESGINLQLRQAVDNMLEGVQIVDQNWKYIYLNDTAIKHSQFPITELLGRTMMEKYPGIENTELFILLKKCRKDGKQRFMENKFDFPNGSVRWFQLSIQPVEKNLLILSNDITELKRAKLELLNQNEELLLKNKAMLEYQLQLLSTQINPHFIFNALNSVQNYVLSREVAPALEFISEFSKLMRAVLDNSMSLYVSLEKSIEFLEMYLGLELRRLQGKFTYSIDVSEEIDTEDILVPPMLMQPYLENAIIHGLGQIENNGEIKLSIMEKNEFLVIEISDNGIGLSQSMNIKSSEKNSKLHKSWASKINKKRLELLEQLEHGRYKVELEDLKMDELNMTGTLVRLTMPLIYERD